MTDLAKELRELSPTKLALLAEQFDLIRKKKPTNLAISQRPPSDRCLMSFAQERLWFLDQLAPGNPAYNLATIVRIGGELDIQALERTLKALIDRHEILRTTFDMVLGEPVQHILPGIDLSLPIVDLSAYSASAWEEEITRRAQEEGLRSFDLVAGPLIRITLLRRSAHEHALLFTMHHIISDGWSMSVLIHEVTALYAAFIADQPSPLPPLPIQYADFAVWQRQHLTGEILAQQLHYWTQQLDPNPPLLALHPGRERPTVQTSEGATLVFPFPASLRRAAEALSRKENVTLFVTLLSAFKVLLYRHTGQEGLYVGSGIANRNRTEIEGLIGFFINTLVLRTDLSGNPTFRQLLQRVHQAALDAYEYQDLPFEKLVQELRPERNLSYNSLYQVEFVLQNVPNTTLELPGLTLTVQPVDIQIAKCDLNVEIELVENEMVAKWNYSTNLFDTETINRMAQHYQTLLEAAITNPEASISELSLLTPRERMQLLTEWNATQTDFPREACYTQLFEAHVERFPEAVAVADRGHQLTYYELNRQANQLAHRLSRLGVKPETLVGIYMERSVEMLVALLGCLKAGAAFLPLDPSYPEERLAFMCEDAQVKVMITQPHQMGALLEHATHIVRLDRSGETLSDEHTANPTSRPSAENIAYAIYTSGSTGKPKGALISHRALVNFIYAIVRSFGLEPHDRFLQFASLSFDVAIEEIFPAWILGVAVILNDPSDLLAPSDLLKTISREQVTVMELPTAYWHELVAYLVTASETLPPCLRLVIIGGEQVSQEALSAWQRWNVPLLHVYGLTETTVTSTVYAVRSGTLPADILAHLPIGRPLANTQIYLLDVYGQPVPMGMLGEVYIGGEGLARCYLNRPELTAQRFVPHPFSAEPGARLYKTGDLAYYRADGNLVFSGRVDAQVHLRGYRIEPGEIEATLRMHPEIQEAVVLVEEVTSAQESAQDVSKRTLEQLLALESAGADRLLREIEAIPDLEVATQLACEMQTQHEKSQTKIRRFRDFEIAVTIHNPDFLKPPREAQRNWLLRRAMDEFADDLNHLDVISRRMVPGSVRPQLQEPTEWSQSKAEYDGSQLIIQGQQVMQDWEHPLMKAMAKVVTESHGDVIEFGFGMGISATYIQEFGVRSYTIVEANDEVVEYFKKWKSQYPGRDIRLIHKRWHDALDQLGQYDGAFFDTVPNFEEEYLREVIDNVVMAEDIFPMVANCLRTGGVFTWYTNEFDTFSRRHQRLALKYFRSVEVSVCRPLFPPTDCHYWQGDSMVVVKATK